MTKAELERIHLTVHVAKTQLQIGIMLMYMVNVDVIAHLHPICHIKTQRGDISNRKKTVDLRERVHGKKIRQGNLVCNSGVCEEPKSILMETAGPHVIIYIQCVWGGGWG